MHNKDETIIELLDRLPLEESGWQVSDHWSGDLMAIGIVRAKHPNSRLVYVSTYGLPIGRYRFEYETDGGGDEESLTQTGNYTELLAAIIAFLGTDDS